MTSALQVIGIVGIVGGFITLVINLVTITSDHTRSLYKKAFLASIILGFCQFAMSLLFPWLSVYTVDVQNGESWKLRGIPFVWAAYNAQGREYISEFILFSFIGNFLFACLFPQSLLLVFKRKMSKKAPLQNAPLQQ